MREYLDLVDNILSKGVKRQGPKPVGTLTLSGQNVQYDLRDGFPLITTKDLSGSWRAIRAELLWMLSGSTNANELHKYGSKLWDKWAVAAEEKLGYRDGELGPIYGHQLRNFAGHVDQVTQVRDMLVRNPETRRAKISLWNLGDVETDDGKSIVDVAPCITSIHYLVMGEEREEGLQRRLDCVIEHRSCDVAIGGPFDFAQWGGLMTMIMVDQLNDRGVNVAPGVMTHSLTDAHIYTDQIEFMKEQLNREPRSRPRVDLVSGPHNDFENYRVDDFVLCDYYPHPRIVIPVAL